MKVILLEKIKKLGDVGETVEVKNGYARNYLFKHEKALRFTEQNQQKFKDKKDIIQKTNEEKKILALEHSKKIADKTLTFIRQAADDGKLYGSLTHRDVASAIKSQFAIIVNVENIHLGGKIKQTGLYNINIDIHAEVNIIMTLVVARSKEEAQNVFDNKKNEFKEKVNNTLGKDIK